MVLKSLNPELVTGKKGIKANTEPKKVLNGSNMKRITYNASHR